MKHFNRFFLAGAFALGLVAAAHAGQPGNNGNGNGGCGVGQQTNGCGNSTPPTNSDPHAPIGGWSQGQGQTQGQGQEQSQGQSQSQSVNNSGNNVGTGGAGGSASAGASVGNVSTGASTSTASTGAVTNTNTNTNTTGASTSSANNSGSGNSTVAITHEAQRRNPVNTAYAAPVSIGGGVCAYTPASGGVSFIPFSGSLAGAKIDKGCERRANADVLARMGHQRLACELMLNNPEVRTTADRISFDCSAVPSAGYAPESFSAPTTMEPIPNPREPRG